MNTEFFIAKKLISQGKKNFSNSMVKISVFSIAIGITVMILSVEIVTGFQKEIRNKAVGFGGHINITKYNINNLIEEKPIYYDEKMINNLLSHPNISHVQAYTTKAGIIKTDEQIYGVIFKGVDKNYNWSFFENVLKKGSIDKSRDTLSNAVIISQKIASSLQLDIGDPLRTYFINPNEAQSRGRKFYISGIYNTGLIEFDKIIIVGDIAHTQQLNGWGKDSVGGFEVLINDFDNIEKITNYVYHAIDYDLNAKSIVESQPQIFDWLELLDMNVIVIIILMIIVAIMNMITALLILILEKISFIGILKSIGFTNRSIRKIFIYNAAYLILKGLFWGNIIGLSLSYLQYQFKLITLDESSYYMPYVPINFDWQYIALLNIGTLLICIIILIIPSMIISRITPLKTIRYS